MNGLVIIRTQDDMKWWAEGDKSGWSLPAPAAWLWRRWPFRFFRFLYLAIQVERHDSMYRSIGLIPTGYDNWTLYAIRRGWC
jgi:hypothetical protein